MDQSLELVGTEPVTTSTLAVTVSGPSETPLPLVRKQAYHNIPPPYGTSDVLPQERSLSGRTTLGSPQISYKPRHTPVGNVNLIPANTRGCDLGAVAQLAVDGGLSAEHLSHIGHSGCLAHSSISTDSDSKVKPSEAFTPHPRGSGLVISARSKVASPIRLVNSRDYYSQRPEYQATPRCITHQQIHLNRAWYFDCTTMQRFGDARHHRFPVTSRKHHIRYTFPLTTEPAPSLHMTRVGGLVVNPAVVSSPVLSEHQVTFNMVLSKHVSYQSMSACASPTSLKHSVTPSSRAPFFSSATCTPNSTNTPPLPIPSAPSSFGDIVRLGPGDTVTRSAPGETCFNVADLIRMHDCPQPYISMCPIEDDLTNASALLSPHGDRSGDVHYPLLHTSVAPISASKPEETDTRYHTGFANAPLPDAEPRHSDPKCPVLTSTSSQSHPHLSTRSLGFSSPPGTQVARTMRYLRRMRHIFGDSFGYTSSTNSASTGALIVSEKIANSTNSMVELRPREGRAVEALRPASYSCKCTIESVHPEHGGGADGQVHTNPHLFDYVDAFVAFSQSWDAHSPDPASWMRYRVRVLDNVLVLTRYTYQDKNHPECSSQQQFDDHLHIPLFSADITWCPLDEQQGKQSQVHDYATLLDLSCTSTMALCLLRVSTASITCFLLADWELVLKRFDIQLPPRPKVTVSKTTASRSCSLGVAGPPGATPLFRAVGTAAASIGLPSIGRTSVSSLLHMPNSQQSLEISDPIPLGEHPHTPDWRMYEPKGGTKTRSGGVTKAVFFSKQPHSSFGYLHQALSRMRRITTSSDESMSGIAGDRHSASSYASVSPTKSSIPAASNAGSRLAEVDSEQPSSTSSPVPTEALSSKFPQFSLAASVSPTPALRTPYLTFASPSSDSEITPNQSLDNYDGDFHNPPNPNGAQLCSPDNDLTIPINPVAPGEQPPMPTPSRTSDNTSSFIPLPLSPSGHLALHKCPRSTLSPFVPFVVELCVTLVERYGLNCVGLYRLSGSKVAHDFISTELQKTLPEIDVRSDKWNDIHAVCGVLKTTLRNLPDSLFPKVMYADFLAACRLHQREKRLLSIQRLLGIMECYPHHPEYRAHRATLRYLATHLARVSARETVNKMTAYNLALVFAPNLVQPCEDTPELLMSDSKYKILLVETVIKYHAWIFSPDLGLESGCSIPPDSVEDVPLAVSVAPSELELVGRSPTDPCALVLSNSNLDSEDPANQPGRLEGDVRPLVAELLYAAADLPPPPSDTDLETAEEPGPSSDRPSDISTHIMRPRFTSIPTSTWSAAAVRSPDTCYLADPVNFHPELILTLETDVDASSARCDCEVSSETMTVSGVPIKQQPFAAQLGSKLDSLRHLSQGCLDQYTSEARELGVRVAETRRHLQNTVAQRMYAEHLLQEARSQFTTDQPISSVAQSFGETTESLQVQEGNTLTSCPSDELDAAARRLSSPMQVANLSFRCANAVPSCT